ncbi:MAG: hypothetical protein ACRBBW_03355 [Cellvibrionaceae bacterium]
MPHGSCWRYQSRVFIALTATLLLLIGNGASAADRLGKSQDHRPKRSQSDIVIVGDAYSLSDGKLRYRELHYADLNDPLGNVIKKIGYQDNHGDIFAEKTLFFSGSDSLLPELEQSNHNTGRRLSLKKSAGLALNPPANSWTLDYQSSTKIPSKRSTLSSEVDTKYLAVIDAGFDAWIAQHWPQLEAGQQHKFLFLAATKARWIQLQASRRVCSEPSLPGVSWFTDSVCIVVEPSNSVLRWLVDPIELGYQVLADGTPRLHQFVGLANLADRDGRGMRVAIHYHYLPSPSAEIL